MSRKFILDLEASLKQSTIESILTKKTSTWNKSLALKSINKVYKNEGISFLPCQDLSLAFVSVLLLFQPLEFFYLEA